LRKRNGKKRKKRKKRKSGEIAAKKKRRTNKLAEVFLLPLFLYFQNARAHIYGTKTVAAMIVVHRPFLCPVADCVTLVVFIISPLVLNNCFLSSQAVSGSNSSPMLVASIVAAKSSA
jgi:hypothetical protein